MTDLFVFCAFAIFAIAFVLGKWSVPEPQKPYTIVYEADCYIGDSKDESRLIRLTVDDMEELINE